MQQLLEFLPRGLVASGLLLLAAACQERTPDNPNPKYPLPRITVTLPPGSHQASKAWVDSVKRVFLLDSIKEVSDMQRISRDSKHSTKDTLQHP